MTNPLYNKDRFKKLISKKPSGFLAAQAVNKIDKNQRMRSFKVALNVLEILGHKNMTKTELAVKIGVTPQQISKWLNGKSNMTLDTIEKIEDALGYKLIEVRKIDFERESRNIEFVMKKIVEQTVKVNIRKQETSSYVFSSKDDFRVYRKVHANSFDSISEADKNLRPTG